jgi:hypothetical protein
MGRECSKHGEKNKLDYSPGRLKCRQNDNVTMDLKQTGAEGMESNELLSCIKCKKLPD